MRNSPERSTQAMEPPPAPMVEISIIGVRITMPKSIVVCAVTTGRPPLTTATSKLVPPTSPVSTSSRPTPPAIAAAAPTPAAGPDSAVRTGKRRAASTLITPPLDATIRSSPTNPASASADSSAPR